MKKQTIKVPKLKQRVIWDFKPTTRIKPSKKLYNRKKIKNEILQTKYVYNINYNLFQVALLHKNVVDLF